VTTQGDTCTATVSDLLCISICILIIRDSSTRTLRADTSTSEAGDTWRKNVRLTLSRKSLFHTRTLKSSGKILGRATDVFTSPPKDVVLRICIALKKPSSSAEFERANLGSKGKHAPTILPRATV
jgi:hypothetical protein